MLIKYCGGCGKKIQYPNSYCPECKKRFEEQQKSNRQASNRRYNETRNKKELQFYKSKEWRMLSSVFIQKAGYRCQKCGGIAAEVHHIKPIQTPEGWEKRLDWDNLEALCTKCHNERHGRFTRKKERT